MIVIIQSFHLIFCLFILLSIFVSNIKYKQYALTLLILLLYKYIFGIKTCGITQLEYYIRGETYKEGFLYRIVKSIITTPEHYFDKYLFVLHIIWIVLLSYQLF